MVALGAVELQGTGECLQHRVRDAGRVAALETGVVVDADPGEERHLFAAQTRDAALTGAIGAEPCLLGSELCAAARQELAELAPGVHAGTVAPPGAG